MPKCWVVDLGFVCSNKKTKCKVLDDYPYKLEAMFSLAFY